MHEITIEGEPFLASEITDHGIYAHNAIVCYDDFSCGGSQAGVLPAVEVVCYTKYFPMSDFQRDGCIVTIDPNIEGD